MDAMPETRTSAREWAEWAERAADDGRSCQVTMQALVAIALEMTDPVQHAEIAEMRRLQVEALRLQIAAPRGIEGQWRDFVACYEATVRQVVEQLRSIVGDRPVPVYNAAGSYLGCAGHEDEHRTLGERAYTDDRESGHCYPHHPCYRCDPPVDAQDVRDAITTLETLVGGAFHVATNLDWGK